MRPRGTLAACVLIALAGCATVPAPPPDVALGAPAAELAQPVDGAELAIGVTHRFADLLPATVDLDLVNPPAEVYPLTRTSVVFLAGDAAGETDVVAFAAADRVELLADPLRRVSEGYLNTAPETVAIAPGDVLPRLAALPFLEVVVPERDMVVSGLPARAVDVRVPPFPAGTEPCGPDEPLLCADLWSVGNVGQAVIEGQELRLAELALPSGYVLVVQNLLDPRSQEVLDRARFVERTLPPELGPARLLPSTSRPLPPDRTYGAELPDLGLGVAFDVGDVPTSAFSDGCPCVLVLAPDAPAGFATELHGFVAPTADLLVPEPGVDPRLSGSTGGEGGTAGLIDVVASQAWADVVAGPVDSVVGGHPARTVDVRLRPGTGTVECRSGRPEEGTCAVLLHGDGTVGTVLLSERVLRVSEVVVAGQDLTVVSSVDEAGTEFAESLRLVELPR